MKQTTQTFLEAESPTLMIGNKDGRKEEGRNM